MLAQVLNIKPLIGVEKERGTYVQLGQARTLDRAILKIADYVRGRFAPGAEMHFQLLHGHNAEGAAMLRERLEQLFKCTFLPTGSIAPVLGAHTGPGLVGLAFAPMSAFPEVP